MPPVPLAASLGDPAGVGPELLAEAWIRRETDDLPPFFVTGGAQLMAAAARLRGLSVPVAEIFHQAEAAECFARALPVLAGPDGDYAPGRPDRAGAELALASLTEATRLAVDGEVDGVVTGPIHKARLAEVGFIHPGQTEFVAEACGVQPGDAVMMLAGPHLRTVPLTVHVALAEVAAAISEALVERKGRIVAAALKRDFGLDAPRIAVAALNPHAGEEGRMGDEEARLIAPAIERLRAEGIAIDGPFAADGLFAPRQRETFDVALCMYHDQALIPLKALDFDQGVNVTLGLPIIRTSPDHGTAFSIAGTGKADAGAMIAAIRMAGDCAQRRFGN
ncbi:4-hydroxythreonine-4-phosphate dehydrogenase [Novosphingobium kunmingense]|uniref:4-hydroxythreonine-4-phosphate dehydrogenase n=1 Tax=Novosphingobium kunmingense TaxID=1211806 RepID=A0A2N0I0Y3_9SPHN|nr:4-hydroxythreonine-4-phosphate dehydrogenase PdxA [Novosphingobium kunmingense]PKB24855.1 4-hydroxythreonine-4-phosphate dehydrogenase [Novosphingobium kunmingense]